MVLTNKGGGLRALCVSLGIYAFLGEFMDFLEAVMRELTGLCVGNGIYAVVS